MNNEEPIKVQSSTKDIDRFLYAVHSRLKQSCCDIVRQGDKTTYLKNGYEVMSLEKISTENAREIGAYAAMNLTVNNSMEKVTNEPNCMLSELIVGMMEYHRLLTKDELKYPFMQDQDVKYILLDTVDTFASI